MKISAVFKFPAVLSAFFIAGSALAQNAGTVSLNAFAIGLGPGVQGFKSVLCTGFAVGTGSGAAPTCRVIQSSDIPASVALTGAPTAPTAAVDTNTTQLATTAFVLGQAAAATPLIDGAAAVGSSTRYARGDHAHPTDTTRAPVASPTFTGIPAAPTAAVDTNTTQLATTAYVIGQAASATPLIDGTAAVGTSTRFARGDHVHPTDSTRAPLASPTFTGIPAVPTAAVNTNTTQAASTAFVVAQIAGSTAGVAQLNGQTGTLTLLTEPQGRLTLQANTPVMVTSQSAQATLRYDSYIGNQVPYYTGSVDGLDVIASNEVTDAMVSAASAGQVVSGQVYDAWWVHGGANRLCLAMSASTGGGGGWASDTGGSNIARGTGFSQLDRITRPYITNKNSLTNCFNGATNYGPVSANQATYLGTIYATANGQSSFTFAAIGVSGGTAGLLGVYNYYNRLPVSTTGGDTSTGYAYATATWRQARGTAIMQVAYVQGGPVDEDAKDALFSSITNTSNTANCGIGIGVDTTGGVTNGAAAATNFANSATGTSSLTVPYSGTPGVGFHTISANEIGCTGGVMNVAASPVVSGNTFIVKLRM